MSTTMVPRAPDVGLAPPGGQRRPLSVFFAGLLVVLAVLGIGGVLLVQRELDPGEAVVGVSEVAVRDNEFGPAAIEVPAGTTVTWRWDGEEEHNVVGDGFESPVLAKGEFRREFAEAGTYDYRCTLHYFMRGEVVVTD